MRPRRWRVAVVLSGSLLAVLAATIGGSIASAQQTASAEQTAQPAAPPVHPGRRIPPTADFPTGPAIGERLPDFTLRNQRGETVDFHADRAGHKAAVLFQRSAVW